MSKERWDSVFAALEYIYGTAPNEYFKQELDKLKPGKILLPAEGEGRNAVYAAKQGWEVWAFDQSDEGKKKALALASRENVRIEYMIRDLETITYNEKEFDVLALIFVHTPEQKRQKIHRDLIKYLKPGGTLILEGFSKEQLQFTSGGPKEISMLFSKEDLLHDFSELQIITIDQQETEIDEGSYHRGKASVIHMVAKTRTEK